MKPLTKLMTLTFLLSGLVYAGVLAGFDYSEGNEFKLWKFVFNACFFGLFMALMARYNYKKKNKEKENSMS
jgi:ABC-type Mn2+/Zn2+ transport system permease subunit